MSKIQTVSSIVQAFSTIVLVIVTAFYAVSTEDMKNVMTNQSNTMSKQADIMLDQSNTMSRQLEMMLNQSDIMSRQFEVMLNEFEVSSRPYITVNGARLEYSDIFGYTLYIDFTNKMSLPAKLTSLELELYYFYIADYDGVSRLEDKVLLSYTEPLGDELIFSGDTFSAPIFLDVFNKDNSKSETVKQWLDAKFFNKIRVKAYYKDTSQKENSYCSYNEMYYDEDNKLATNIVTKTC